MSLKIVRVTEYKNTTLGLLLLDGRPFLTTLEPAWNNNQKGKSCIPVGTYRAMREFSNKFSRQLYELKDVPDRNEIKFHAGNTAKDTEGCIILGTYFGSVDNVPAVTGSARALERFMCELKHKPEIKIEIVQAY